MMKRTQLTRRLTRALGIGAAIGAIALATPAVQAQNPAPPPLPPQNPAVVQQGVVDFIEGAAQCNRTDLAMANVAEDRAQNPAVKELARRIRAEHQENFDTLQTIARERELPVFRSLNEENRHDLQRLQNVRGADFDREYTRFMLEAQVKCIRRFDQARADFQQPYLRHYVETTLPVLRKDLRHTEIAARAVGLDRATIGDILKGLPSEEAERGVTFNSNDR